MSNLKSIMAGCVLAGAVGLAGLSPAQAAWEKLPLVRGPGPVEAVPADVCSAFSVSKRFTLADADFALVRDQVNAALDAAGAGAAVLPKAAGHRIAPDAVQFGLRLDHARCDQVPGPLETALPMAMRAGQAKECLVPECEELVPGWRAPEGSTLVLWTCEHNVFREVIYVRINNTWRAKKVREEHVTTCEVEKEPWEEGGMPGDGKQ